MNKVEQDWNKLIDDWQQGETNSSKTRQQAVDQDKHLNTLAKKVKKDSELERIGLLFTAAMTLIVGLYLFNEIRLGLPSKFDYVLYCAMLFLTMMLGILTVWYQRNSWKNQFKHSTQYVDIMLRQNQAAWKVAKVGEMFGYGLLLVFYGVVLWAFFPSLLAGTLVNDLGSVAKPILGSVILLCVTLTGLLAIFFNRRLQRSYQKKADMLRALKTGFE